MVKVLPHKHCVICGKAIDTEKQVCSTECGQQLQKNQRRQKLSFYMLIGIMVILIVVMFLGF